MSHIHGRNEFHIYADDLHIDKINENGEVKVITGSSNSKLVFHQPLDIDGSKGSFIQGKKGQQLIKDETGNAIMEVKSDGNLKLLTSVDFNNQAPVNFSGGGGGGATTTSGIDSENLPGQTLEDELDAITLAGTNQGNQITANTTAIATNTGNIAALTTQQNTNTGAITTNTGNITALTTQQNTNTGNIATNTTNITNLTTQQTTNTNTIATNGLAITSLGTQQATNTANITSLTTTQGTQGTSITALQTQQALNTSAIASNTARTSNLTADRILISSAVGTINTAGIGVNDVATKNSANDFTGGLGNPATTNTFDTVSASAVNNTGATESASYTQGGAALNFSHLAGSVDPATQLPTTVMRTDKTDQTIQGNPTTSSLTKVSIDNTHASGNSQLVIQKRSTVGVLEGGLTIQQTTTGTNITGQAPAGQTPDISITPANGSLAMTIGGLESRFHNNLKIIGSMSGAARSDNKDYIFKTIGATGTGDVLLLEDVLQRPKQGNPALGFNPSANSLVEISTAGVPSYKDTSNFLSKPGLVNPSLPSFVEVQTGGTFAYKPSSFIPLPGGTLPSSNENVVFVNPAGTSYTERANIIERPGNANPTSGTKLITINNVGTRAYKDLGQFLTTPGSANPSNDSLIQISSTGVQSYVETSTLQGISKPGGANPGAQSFVRIASNGATSYEAESNIVKKDVANQVLNQTAAANSITIQCDSATNSDDASLKILRSFSGVENNSIEFIPKPGANTQWRCKNDLDIFINNSQKFRIGNHTSHVYHPFQFEDDARLKHGQTIPTQSAFTGVAGTIRFDDNHLYVCRSNGNWKRVALSTF